MEVAFRWRISHIDRCKGGDTIMKSNEPAFILCVALLISCVTSLHATAPVVNSVSPTSHSLIVQGTSDITATFDQPINPSSFSSADLMVFGHWSGIMQGLTIFENGNMTLRFSPQRSFSAGELVTVTLSKNLQNTTGESMLHGYSWTFWIQTAPGSFNFVSAPPISTRRSGEGRIQSYGAYGGDFNEDGFSDLAIPNEISVDVRLFLNNGAGSYGAFAVYPMPGGSSPSPNEGADFNGDGHLDYAVGNGGNNKLTIFMGDGMGNLTTPTNYAAAQQVRGVAIDDLDGDGDMDIVTANRSGSNVILFSNDGTGSFTATDTLEANVSQETACATADANGDGILDLFVGGFGSNEISLMLGDGQGSFVFSHKRPAKGRPWMIAVGDVNGDGNVDVVSANNSFNNASVLFGDGMGHLDTAVTYPTGSIPIAIDLGDIDGDGDLDLVTSNYASASWTVYENDGSGIFINPRTLNSSSTGSCATLHDRDNDGDLDFTGIDEVDDLIFLFTNNPPVSVESGLSFPAKVQLGQNYPNPFNNSTKISFFIPSREHVSLVLYDMLGRAVHVLVNEDRVEGTHQAFVNAEGLGSGTYFYRLRAGDFVETRKMVYLR